MKIIFISLIFSTVTFPSTLFIGKMHEFVFKF